MQVQHFLARCHHFALREDVERPKQRLIGNGSLGLISVEFEYCPLAIGVTATGLVMFMRARFYWWPVQPIGLLAISSWQMDRIWLPFFLGWLIKLCLVKFGTGRMVHGARAFFMAFILDI